MRRVRPQWLMPCLVLAGLALAGAVHAQVCEPEWQPTFGGLPGFDDPVHALARFDDGGGEQLFAGGEFDIVAGASGSHGLARWDGAAWHPAGGALGPSSSVEVYALAVFDDGGGDALYVGGSFATADGLASGSLARWDGASWSVVGAGPGVAGDVHALTVFDDGSGPALYVGGDITSVDGMPVSGLARWDGVSWSNVGGGVDFDFASSEPPQVRDLLGFDDGSGAQLYAAGYFDLAGGVAARSIARWDGAAWSNLGPGLGASDVLGIGACLEVFDDGGGPALYVGGNFREIQGQGQVRSIAKWDGTSGEFASVGGGLSFGGSVSLENLIATDLAVFEGRLWVTGTLTSSGGSAAARITSWDGASWSAPATGLVKNSVINGPKGFALCVHDDGSGEKLFVGGEFDAAGGVDAHHVAAYASGMFERVGPANLDDRVLALAVFDDADGPTLYAGGEFNEIDGTPLGGIARFVDGEWQPVGGGLQWLSNSGVVRALAVFDDGSGEALYAGGLFFSAGGVPVSHVARWDGTQWSALPGMPLDDTVTVLRVLDIGNGPELFAGGQFKAPARHVARWTGSAWRDLGGGVFDNQGFVPDVDDLAAYDDGRGEGPVLYVTGAFHQAGSGVPTRRLARWNGVEWSGVGDVGEVTASNSDHGFGLAVFDDGKGFGPELFLAGRFSEIDDEEFVGIAKWNGARWAKVGAGLTSLTGLNASGYALAVHDDGSGPALFVGGSFLNAGMQAAARVARWDGLWSSLGGGVSGPVRTLLSVSDASGNDVALYAGGEFISTLDSGDSYVARWAGCSGSASPWVNLGHGLWNGADQAPLLAGTGSLEPGSSGSVKLSLAKSLAPALLFASTASTPVPFRGGTLVPFPAALIKAYTTNAAGARTLPFADFPSGFSGLGVDMQFAVQDNAAAFNATLSNALRANLP